MKRFLELTVQAKFVWGLFFSSAMLIYIVVEMILGHTSIDIITVWQMVGITLALTFLHYLIFGELILKSMSTRYKTLIHSVLCYLMLVLSVIWAKWISIYSFNAIIIFTISYVIFYLLCVFSFYIYYKATGEELNKKLTAYKEKRNLN